MMPKFKSIWIQHNSTETHYFNHTNYYLFMVALCNIYFHPVVKCPSLTGGLASAGHVHRLIPDTPRREAEVQHSYIDHRHAGRVSSVTRVTWHCTFPRSSPGSSASFAHAAICGTIKRQKQNITRMWANAQPDGRPAEHRWRPLFDAAKFG